MMPQSSLRPNPAWLEDWKVGVFPDLESDLCRWMLQVFSDFWTDANLDEKSISTQRRYSNALHAIGGYAIDQLVRQQYPSSVAFYELFISFFSPIEGPLIFQDEEAWQREIDTVSKKLYKYFKSRKTSMQGGLK
jgi:hypothetical protein